MSALEGALLGVVSFLEEREVPYMVVGGLANAVWGEPRVTLDIDVTVWVEDREIPSVVADLTSAFLALDADPEAFVRRTRVLPLESGEGVRIDVIFGLLPFEHEAIRRARPIPIGGGSVRFCTAEDLVLMKIISNRDRDQSDARAIVLRRLADLDLGYLEPRILELAELLARDDIKRRWEEWKAAAATGGR
jgi:hypothetical protein